MLDEELKLQNSEIENIKRISIIKCIKKIKIKMKIKKIFTT